MNDVDVGGESEPGALSAADVSAEPTTDRIAKDIARRQVRELDALALIGYPTRFSGFNRDTVAYALYLGARDVMEREVANRETV